MASESSADVAHARVVITRALPASPDGRTVDDLFADAGITDVWTYPTDGTIPRDELLERVAGAHALIATPADVAVNGELFDAAGPQFRVVSNYAVGYDNVDLAAAADRDIRVGHTPHAVTEPTADIAWLLILGAARRAHEGEALARGGGWTGVAPEQLLGQRLHGATLFIVGAGRIGYATARRSIGWEMRVLYHARTDHPEFEAAPIHAERVSLEEGLAAADVVSLHTPLTPDTRHLIDAAALARMKRSAVLVNTARGAVVDEAALIDALERGTIAAAGLDVYEREPAVPPRLAALPNTFLLPHLGSATRADRWWMVEIAVANTIAALRGAALPHEVPAPPPTPQAPCAPETL